jgi:hypothetical protein
LLFAEKETWKRTEKPSQLTAISITLLLPPPRYPQSIPLPLSLCLDRRFSLILLLSSFPFCVHKIVHGNGKNGSKQKVFTYYGGEGVGWGVVGVVKTLIAIPVLWNVQGQVRETTQSELLFH